LALWLNNDSWDAAAIPGLAAADYARASRIAEIATLLAPIQAGSFNTMAMAQYRVGKFEAAVASAEKSMQFGNRNNPLDLAIRAVARHQLGQTADASNDLKAAREAAKSDRYSKDRQVQQFLAEAERLITPDSGGK
jgi:hypothetical protein